jgi:tetratricopeptide (TPR) repeat protein
MEAAQVDWVPAISMLAAGVVAGIALIVWFRRSAPARVASLQTHDDLVTTELEIRDLEAHRDALLRQLRELDDTSSKLAPWQLAEERYRLELETAEVLRALEAEETKSTSSGVLARDPSVGRQDHALSSDHDGPVPAAPHSAMAGFLWGVGSMAAIAALIVLVVQRATPREEGGSPTGSVPPMQQAPVAGPDVATLQQAVDANPDDLNARLDLAFAYLAQRDLMQVFTHTQFVLDREPENPRALSLQALVRLAMGQPEDAVGMLKKAIEKDPDLLDAWLHLGIVYAQMGKTKESNEALQEAMRRHPEERETLEAIARDLQPGGTAPPSAPPPAQPAAGPTVSGTIELGAGAARPSGGQLFVSVRPAGVAAGPPVAVKMLGAISLPATFTITAGDSMMGQPLPETMRIEARFDTDGDVMSRGAGDLQGFVDNVAIGTRELTLTLR